MVLVLAATAVPRPFIPPLYPTLYQPLAAHDGRPGWQMQSRRDDPTRKQGGRLPTIAPKDEQPASPLSNLTVPLASSFGSELPRTRLPPRSRTGCWTCRTRKVKCDEQRPTCSQCARLQHMCDYSPRLIFRDDTPRVIERMQEVSVEGSNVWDPQQRVGERTRRRSSEDLLPPFNSLTTDEERERQAELQSPGTYHVVVNHESFQSLPEYTEEPSVISSRRPSLPLPGNEDENERRIPTLKIRTTDIDDPNVIILRKFEDCVRRIPSSTAAKTAKVISPQNPGSATVALADDLTTALGITSPQSPLQAARRGGHDARLLDHYRNFISPKIVHLSQQGPYGSGGIEDSFEQKADEFPPLYHAMMALSALSLAHRDGAQNVDALQHYQQALPSLNATLKSTSDLSSDGALFTNLFLLLYEIAAATQSGDDLWSPHLNQLLTIISLRCQMFGHEPYTFILWFVCIIDTTALLSSSGNGQFVRTIIDNDFLPMSSLTVDSLLESLSPNEREVLPPVLRFNQQVFVRASQIGHLARELRAEDYATNSMLSAGGIDMIERYNRIAELRRAMRHAWTSSMPSIALMLGMDNTSDLQPRALGVFEQACALFRATIIFSHTSMYAAQRVENGPESIEEIALCVRETLKLAQSVVNFQRTQLRFMAFPIFMAGFASDHNNEKMLALELMRSLEEESMGLNTSMIRKLLESVYERQSDSLINTGHSYMVDWVEIMAEQGLQAVNFGI